MATRNPAVNSPVEGKVVEIPLCTGFWDTSQVVVQGHFFSIGDHGGKT